MAKYGFMPGTQEVTRENPPVRSKFDKSQGKGLKPPHLSFPGGTAKVTGSSHAGFTANGNMIPKSSAPRGMPNTLSMSKPGHNLMAGAEPETLYAGTVKPKAQRDSGIAGDNSRGGTTAKRVTITRPQKMENSSSRTSGGPGVLSGGPLRK